MTPTALETAEAEAVATNAILVEEEEEDIVAELEEGERDPELEFWDEIGIDCIEITVGGRSGWTLRCYLDDEPVFLSKANRIQIFSTDEKLENYLTDAGADHKLASLAVWPEIREAIDGGDAVVVAGPENTYVLDGLADESAGRSGPSTAGSWSLPSNC